MDLVLTAMDADVVKTYVELGMGVGIIGAFASQAPHPGVAFIKLEPPGVSLDIFAACAQNSKMARHLGELIVAEAQRAARRL